MRIIKAKNYDDMSRKAANIIAAQVNLKPNSVLGLATGSSPIGTYENLVKLFNQGDVDFSEITTINLDEYRGLNREHEQSYWYFMQEHFFSHVNVNKNQVFVPNGENLNINEACKEYDEIIEKSGGIDLQLLGIGFDGHIGFNEPDTYFELNTHCVDLADSTIEANKRFFNSKAEVPKQAYTMGIKAIMQAKTVMMIVSGKEKANIIKQAFTGNVTPEIPASILQLHSNFILVADEAALSEM